MKDKTPFERTIQEKLEGYQAPSDPSAWEGIEAELDRMDASQGNSGQKGHKTAKWGAIAAGGAALLIGGGLLLGHLDEEESDDRTNEGAPSKELVEHSREKTSESSSDQKEALGDGPAEKAGNDGSTPTDVEKKESREKTGDDNPSEDPSFGTKKKGTPQKGVDESNSKAEGGSEAETPLDEGAPFIQGSKDAGTKDGKAGSNPIPSDLRIRTERSKACPGTEVSFELSEKPEGVNYLWEFGDGKFSNKATPEHLYEASGSYRVTATLTHQESGKTRKFVTDEKIKVHERPSATIENPETPRHLRRTRKVTLFELKGLENVDRVVWDLGDGSRVEGKQKVVHQYPIKGIYSVEAYLESEKGCKDTVSFQHEQEKSYDRNLLAPKAFTPDGDGRNDRFIPKALKVLEAPFTMTIHDRSGRVVHKTKNASRPWNGRLQNSGQKLKEGVYLWVVVLENEKGEEETYKDAITLKR